jgi:uncharacterized protein YfaS (alpha-2-macroglobulin family)
MRGFLLVTALSLATLALSPHAALSQDAVPERRSIVQSDIDLPGGDLVPIYDTTAQGCERICLADARCVAFTFNARNGSCFPKSSAGEAVPYPGALSGRVVEADPTMRARAGTLRGDLARFLYPYEFAEAATLAADAALAYPGAGESLEAAREGAARAAVAGDLGEAVRLSGVAVAIGDLPQDWIDHARHLLARGAAGGFDPYADMMNAQRAAMNGYMRSADADIAHDALRVLAEALEPTGRGAAAIKALRLAQERAPRSETAAALERLVGLYGFGIVEHTVESDLPSPRLCATFGEDLIEKGFDYAPFVRLPEPGLSVEVSGSRQLCVGGLGHGARVSVTFREGLPSASGETMAAPIEITAYVRDRSPAVRFPGRGYVLPAAGPAALPVETVNAESLDLVLYRISDANILRAYQDQLFARPIAEWRSWEFEGTIGEKVWTGSATVGIEQNRDVTTRLPLGAALAGRAPGLYVLRADLPRAQDNDGKPSAWQWFVVSDLGITTYQGVDGLGVVVRGLGDAGPKPGATVRLRARSNRDLAQATTDAEGVARFPAGLMGGADGAEAVLVIVEDGAGDMAMLSLAEPEFDLSDRGVSGRESAPPIDVFLATDRGAYRAGETVHLTALARGAGLRAIEGLPISARLRRPDGVEYARLRIAEAGAGGHVGAFEIAPTAPRGAWRVEVFAEAEGAPLASAGFVVEDFLPERIDFTLTPPDGAPAPGAEVVLPLSARYLFGAPAGDLAVEGEVLLRAAEGLAAWPGFRFGRADTFFAPQMEPLPGRQTTDGDGSAEVRARIPDAPEADRALEAEIRVRLGDGAGRPVERRLVLPVAAPEPLIGIRPGFDGVAPEGGEARFAIVAVGPDGGAAAMAVKWRLERIETRWQWYDLWGNWNWEPVTTRTRVAEGELALGAAPADIAVPVAWGEYELSVTRADGAAGAPPGGASLRFAAGWYAAADAAATPDTLDVALDRPAYKAGDTARLRIVPRAEGTALIAVMSNRLIALRAVPVGAEPTTIELPVTEEWASGAYVTATLLRPMATASGRLPARAIGLAHAALDPGQRRLGATLRLPDETAPRAPLDIALEVSGIAPGETAFATIAAVDVGILNLTGFANPDPSAHYFGQRRLGIGIRDLYGRLIDGMNGAEGEVRSGGDAGFARFLAPPPTEETVAFFSGPVTVGADGIARTGFDLPPFNGTVRVMAVVWSPSGVGEAAADVLVRDPVVLDATLPRFLAPGDRGRMLIDLVHAKGPAGEVALEVEADGVTLGPVPGRVTLGAGARVQLPVALLAEAAGSARISVRLVTPGGEVLERAFALDIRRNDPEVVRVVRVALAPGQTLEFGADILADFVAGTGRASVTAGPLAAFDAAGILTALDRYPYGCTEQITSRALPLLYLSEVAAAAGLGGSEAVADRIEKAIAGVLVNQTPAGGFGLWSGETSQGAGLWLDAYVTDFLTRARAQGHAVPERALAAALDALRSQVNYAGDFEAGGGDLAYALMVLAREGEAAMGDLRYFADVKGDAFDTPIGAAQLGAALAAYGEQIRADRMFARAAAMLDDAGGRPEAALLRADFGTHLRDGAGVLALAAEAGSSVVSATDLAARLAAEASGRRLSTQEAAWLLMAAHGIARQTAAAGITIDGAPAGAAPVARVPDPGAPPVRVSNSGTTTESVSVAAFGVPLVAEPAGGSGYAITRRYFTPEGEPVETASVAVGTRLVAVIEVRPLEDGGGRIMVNDPLPAGFEIENPNLLRGGDLAGLGWLGETAVADHAEFRADRFLAALTAGSTAPLRLAYRVRAATPGEFHHPAAGVEDMYRPDRRARTAPGRLIVTE